MVKINLSDKQKAIATVAAHVIMPVAVVVAAKLIEKKFTNDKTAE
jgi:hypothetical protein